ncbi:hypothetical protein Mpt1_c03960 [Candidatus Methanoplasma termitum]|uniref:Uncharacterized protein n=1 Tax=Candidatus Methanoplasma termitum TaxID=1577791 RepID=A0A0A7LAU3_9ARCH|nr:hypothetical protein [Candidatus Methanoplasma termitum]AIZ56290.1 hypothetical protein Mpt1_c03960 [Candidatus Methanoplasma termitum]MCL2333906.1 hypothetical protein [Candidatus Methanoplasma sp.]
MGFVTITIAKNRGRAIIVHSFTSNRVIPQGDAGILTLDSAGPRSFTKIYCACGKIVDLDKKKMNIKKSLKKDLECTTCRNARISREIDSINEHFDGPLSKEEESFC